MNTIISARQLGERLGDPGLVILDARWDLMQPTWGREVFEEAHIPSARYVNLDIDLAGAIGPGSGRHPLPDAELASAAFRRLGVHNDSTVVIYDQANGAYAARAWWMLRWLGLENVVVLDGGLAAWNAGGLPLDRSTPEPGAGTFSGRIDASWVVQSNDLLRLIAEGIPLFDARDAERFAGKLEPIDTVAGHIPGATNAPFSSFLDRHSRFLPASALQRRWTRELGVKPDGDWMVMCGSGVTACHLALSGQIAGLRMPRLYAGSWSEWIRDSSRPVARN